MSGGATLSDVYQQARHSLLVVRDGLERLERLESSSSTPYYGAGTNNGASSSTSTSGGGQDLAQHVKLELAQLQNYSSEMERLSRLQLPKGQREIWKRKIEQVSEEVDSLKLGLDKHLSRQHRRQADAQLRAELFQRTNGEASRIVEMYDLESQARDSVQNSSRLLEDITSTGIAVLGKYAEQRERLKAAQRKALDIMNVVGLSNSILRVIDRRLLTDKWIAYTGMLITILVVIAVLIWTH